MNSLAPDGSRNNGSYDFNGLRDDDSQTTGGIHNSVSGDVNVSIGEHDGQTGDKGGGAYLSFEKIELSIDDANSDMKDDMNGTGRKFILDNVSGEAFPSQILGIIGASGGGKTTLLSLISGRLYRIESLASKSVVSCDCD